MTQDSPKNSPGERTTPDAGRQSGDGPDRGSPALEPDESENEPVIDDGDSAVGSFQSSTVSVREEMILQLREHGRQYQGYMEAKYVLPMDEQEMERLADAHPETEVLGVDLAPVQPDCVPPNLMFEVDDLEQPWNFTYKFDYIHSQLMIGAFRDWPKFFSQSFEFLESDGYLEVHDIDFVIRCDDGTLPDDSALARWHRTMHEGAAGAGFPLDAIGRVPAMMAEAGFVDVEATPVKWPINPWPRDQRHKELGRWAMENFAWGCESMSLALFTRALGWSADEVRVFMAHVRRDLRNRRIHAYWNFWIVYGRKPGEG